MNALDLQVSRHLKKLGFSISEIRIAAYILVTYAIELRAGEHYYIYQTSLKKHQSKVQVQSILLEEKEHLQEMEREITDANVNISDVKIACQLEAHLFEKWLHACLLIKK